MRELLAEQETGIRFWAALSSAVLAMLCLVAGAALLFTEKLATEWDIETPVCTTSSPV